MMKKLFSSLLIATILGAATYSPGSQAGFVILNTGGAVALVFHKHPTPVTTNVSITTIGTGIVTMNIGFVTLLANVPAGLTLIILSEDGTTSQTEIEDLLTEKYPFIADHEVIISLAAAIQTKVRTERKSIVSLTEIEVKSILTPADLTSEEVAVVVQDFK